MYLERSSACQTDLTDFIFLSIYVCSGTRRRPEYAGDVLEEQEQKIYERSKDDVGVFAGEDRLY